MERAVREKVMWWCSASLIVAASLSPPSPHMSAMFHFVWNGDYLLVPFLELYKTLYTHWDRKCIAQKDMYDHVSFVAQFVLHQLQNCKTNLKTKQTCSIRIFLRNAFAADPNMYKPKLYEHYQLQLTCLPSCWMAMSWPHLTGDRCHLRCHDADWLQCPVLSTAARDRGLWSDRDLY